MRLVVFLLVAFALAAPLGAAADPLPLPPSNLTWQQTGPGTVLLTWDAPLASSGPVAYEVYGDGALLGTTSATDFTGTFSGIEAFSVVAVQGSQQSPPVAVLVGVMNCSPVLISTYDQPPYVSAGINTECLPIG